MKIRKKIKKAKKLLKNYAYPVDCESCPVDREVCSLEADDVGCHYVLEKFIAENERSLQINEGCNNEQIIN